MSPVRRSTNKRLANLCYQKGAFKTQREAQEAIKRFIQRGQTPCTLIEYVCFGNDIPHWHVGHYSAEAIRQSPAMFVWLQKKDLTNRRVLMYSV
jgi:hypothetical protein